MTVCVPIQKEIEKLKILILSHSTLKVPTTFLLCYNIYQQMGPKLLELL